jgi:hypothetical protein
MQRVSSGRAARIADVVASPDLSDSKVRCRPGNSSRAMIRE